MSATEKEALDRIFEIFGNKRMREEESKGRKLAGHQFEFLFNRHVDPGNYDYNIKVRSRTLRLDLTPLPKTGLQTQYCK